MVWVSVPAGRFTMGCSDGDEDCYDAERPAHEVAVPAFELTATEITQAQFVAVIGENPSVVSECADCPVDSVWWDEAVEVCAALGARLPSEAEWEYAARAGSPSRFGCGDDAACLDAVAWYGDNSDNTTHTVGSKDANDFGLHDMLGSVWEWTDDCWHASYEGAPVDGSAWVDPGPDVDCSFRVVRGGAWGMSPRGVRVSNRDYDYVDAYLVAPPGFRCARDGGE